MDYWEELKKRVESRKRLGPVDPKMLELVKQSLQFSHSSPSVEKPRDTRTLEEVLDDLNDKRKEAIHRREDSTRQ